MHWVARPRLWRRRPGPLLRPLALWVPLVLLPLQIGYAIADMTAKAGFGVLIYLIARAKSTKTASGEAYATA